MTNAEFIEQKRLSGSGKELLLDLQSAQAAIAEAIKEELIELSASRDSFIDGKKTEFDAHVLARKTIIK